LSEFSSVSKTSNTPIDPKSELPEKASDNPYKEKRLLAGQDRSSAKIRVLGDWLQNRRGGAGFRPYSVVARGSLKNDLF
jgi:hypothetical protein